MQMTKKNQRIHFFLFICQFTERKRSGDICGAVHVLSAGICKQEGTWFDLGAGLLRDMIMDYGTVLGKRHDR